MAKAIMPATKTAAAILTIGLNILCLCIQGRMDGQRPRGLKVPPGEVKLNKYPVQSRILSFEISIYRMNITL
jgi:hypothetical protein